MSPFKDTSNRGKLYGKLYPKTSFSYDRKMSRPSFFRGTFFDFDRCSEIFRNFGSKWSNFEFDRKIIKLSFLDNRKSCYFGETTLILIKPEN